MRNLPNGKVPNNRPKRRIINVRKYKAGYEIVTEIVPGYGFGCKDFTLKTARTPDGDYIGDPHYAYFFCKKHGVKPEIRPRQLPLTSSVCSIGYSKKERAWYGWSHRGYARFKIGSEIKIGDASFRPSNKAEFLERLKQDYTNEDYYHNVKFTIWKTGITVKYDVIRQDGSKFTSGWFNPYLKVWGRGEWKAKTLADCKQMAIDFAEGVS